MLTLYLCFLAGGAVLPIISFISGFLGGGTETDLDAGTDIDTSIDLSTEGDMDFDAGEGIETDTDLDIGSDSVLSIGLLPASLMALSALALAFGAVGAVMTSTGKGKVITLIAALFVGYIASVIVQSLIKTLKRLQTRSYGINENELLLYDGKVVDTILPGQLGTVSFVTLKGIRVSYPARCEDPELKLEAGKIVKALDYKEGVFIVIPKNKYE